MEFSIPQLEALRLESEINQRLQRTKLWSEPATAQPKTPPQPLRVDPEKLRGLIHFAVPVKSLRAPAGKTGGEQRHK